MKTNRSNKLFDQTRIATLGLQDLLAFGQLQPDGTYKVRNVTNSNFLNAIVISEQITYAEILALATASELVAGKNYTITNAVSGTLSLYIFAVSTSKLAEYGYDTTTGQVYSYDLATDTATNADNTGYINFTPQTAPAYQRGRVWYDSTTETLSVYDDISGTSVQLGQEEILRARNSTGSTILNGAVVYVSGAQGQNPRVSLALANAESTSRVIGVATHNIDNNSVGKITTFGIVGGLNTSAYNEGDVLYLSASVAGGLTTTRPSAPNQAVMVGTVIHAAVNDGKILVHTDNYGVGFGTANQVRGMNAAGTAEEYKTIQGTASEVEVLHTANTVTIGLPNAVTISGAMTAGSFVKSGGVSAQFLKADGTVDANAYFYTNAQVTGQALTGLSVSGSAVVSTDSILTGIGKLQNQINAVLGSVNFQGVWNASTNTPTLTSSVGTKGYYYIVTVAGSTNLNGITDWKLGDWAIYDGSAWQKVDNTDAVVSVNGYTGIVTLAAADVGALPTSAISGTTGKLAKFTASGTIGDSLLSESSSTVIGDGASIRMKATSYGNNGLFESYGTDNQLKFQAGSNSNTNAYLYAHTGVNLEIYAGGSSRAIYTSDGQYITNGATDTGEAHIFGGSARVNGSTQIQTSAGYNAYFQTSGTSVRINYLNDAFSANVSAAYRALDYAWQDSAGATIFSLASTGAATFSSSVQANSYITSGGRTTAFGFRLPDWQIYNTSGGALAFNNYTTDFLTIASGGSATFSSSVTSGSHTITSGNNITMTQGDIQFLSNSGYGILSADSNRLVAIQNGLMTLNGNVNVVSGDISISAGKKLLYSSTSYITPENNISGAEIATAGVLTIKTGGTTERVRVDASGNVGIGTTSPSSYSFNDPAFLVVANTSGNSTLSIVSNTTGIGYLAFADGTTGTDRYSGSIFYSHSTDTMSFKTAGSDRLEISSTGAATFSSSVTAGGQITTTSTTGYQLISGGNTLFSLGYSGGTLLNRITGTSLFLAENGTPQLTIASGGAATFSNGLTVKSTGYGTIASFLDAANSGIKLVANASVGYNEIISDGNQPFLITVNSAERFRIAGNGAATFSSSVTAGGNLTINGANQVTRFVSSTNAFYSAYVANSVDLGYIGNGVGLVSGGSATDFGIRAETNLIFAISNAEKMRITSSGNVGIGTTNPTNAKLEVVATTGEVFRADASGGAYRIVADQSGVNLQGNINLGTLPTSASGLSTGDIWNDSGTLKIV